LIPPDALAREAADADLVIACTTSHRHVLDAAALAQGRQATRERPGLEATIIVDLGLPRNVDPDVKSLPGVTLIDLETIGSHASLERVDAIGEAVSLVWQATEQYASSARLRDLSPALAALRRHVLDLTDAEVQRALRRGGGAATEEALRHFAGVVLHRPMARARSLAEEGDAAAWIDGLAAVYGIEAEADAAAVALPDSSADLEERSA
jgi:glutamyl-tRNA reductase